RQLLYWVWIVRHHCRNVCYRCALARPVRLSTESPTLEICPAGVRRGPRKCSLLHHAKPDLGILEVVSAHSSGCRLRLLARKPRSIHAGIESSAQGSGLLKLTIVVNAVSSKSGGAATYLQNLIVSLANSRHRYVVFVPET